MSCQIRYKGYVPERKSEIEKVDANIDSKKFFEDFVSKRKPVIIRNLAQGEEWGVSKWSNEYLKEKSGDHEVMVEKIPPESVAKNFGYQIPKVPMKYSCFLDQLNEGDEHLYMTTQEFDCTAENPGLSLEELQADIPLWPSLLSSLVPHQVSLWQGKSCKGASSGLHHDFHDNLYMLLRGRKRFRLFPPSNINLLQTAGKPTVVYENGLVVYNKRHYGKSFLEGAGDDLSNSSDVEFLEYKKGPVSSEKTKEKNDQSEEQGGGDHKEDLKAGENDVEKASKDAEINCSEKQESQPTKECKTETELVVDVREDGLPKLVEARLMKNKALRELNDLERKLAKLGSKVENAEEVDKLKVLIKKWDDVLDKCMEDILVFDDGEDDEEDDYDDEEDEDCDEGVNLNKYGNEIIQLDDDDNVDDVSKGSHDDDYDNKQQSIKRRKICTVDGDKDGATTPAEQSLISNATISEVQIGKINGEDILKNMTNNKCHGDKVAKGDSIIPNHFCKVTLPLESDKLEDIYESVARSRESVTVEKAEDTSPTKEAGECRGDLDDLRVLVLTLEAGESLYLPASWFHEVTSYSLKKEELSSDDASLSSGNQLADHLALNYWFYPPVYTRDDDEKLGSFDHPYCDTFWKYKFDKVQEERRLFGGEKRSSNDDDDAVICIGSSDEDSSED